MQVDFSNKTPEFDPVARDTLFAPSVAARVPGPAPRSKRCLQAPGSGPGLGGFDQINMCPIPGLALELELAGLGSSRSSGLSRSPGPFFRAADSNYGFYHEVVPGACFSVRCANGSLDTFCDAKSVSGHSEAFMEYQVYNRHNAKVDVLGEYGMSFGCRNELSFDKAVNELMTRDAATTRTFRTLLDFAHARDVIARLNHQISTLSTNETTYNEASGTYFNKPSVQQVDSAFGACFGPFPEDVFLYRGDTSGMTTDEIQRELKALVDSFPHPPPGVPLSTRPALTFARFASTSLDLNVALRFGALSEAGLVYSMRLPQGDVICPKDTTLGGVNLIAPWSGCSSCNECEVLASPYALNLKLTDLNISCAPPEGGWHGYCHGYCQVTVKFIGFDIYGTCTARGDDYCAPPHTCDTVQPFIPTKPICGNAPNAECPISIQPCCCLLFDSEGDCFPEESAPWARAIPTFLPTLGKWTCEPRCTAPGDNFCAVGECNQADPPSNPVSCCSGLAPVRQEDIWRCPWFI